MHHKIKLHLSKNTFLVNNKFDLIKNKGNKC